MPESPLDGTATGRRDATCSETATPVTDAHDAALIWHGRCRLSITRDLRRVFARPEDVFAPILGKMTRIPRRFARLGVGLRPSLRGNFLQGL
jgi:hypothetical protein